MSLKTKYLEFLDNKGNLVSVAQTTDIIDDPNGDLHFRLQPSNASSANEISKDDFVKKHKKLHPNLPVPISPDQ